MPDIVIKTKALTRTYHAGDVYVHALTGVDLTIERGELVAIVGASGSGKSTLMAILGCLDRPTSGQYWLEGQDVATLSEPQLARIRSERLGFVFQSFNLLPRTAAIENVALPLFYSSTGQESQAERRERARSALQSVGLADRANNTPGQLSGGQQQRVAIARALINTPAVLFADEPTGNLDTRNSHEIMQALVALNRHDHVTVIVVTHEADIAAYADRVITMRDGAIVSDERKAEAARVTALPSASAERAAGPRRATSATAPASRTLLSTASAWPFVRMILFAAAQAINRNKMRSALTMLGVFIGVAALITMVAVGQGANEAVKLQMQSLGTNMVIVLPGAVTSGGVRAGFGSASTLTVSDADAIRRDCPAVGRVAYVIRQTGQTQYGNQNWTTIVQGITASYADITNWRIAQGRFIEQQDVDRAALVAVIGQTVYRELFAPSENPIGATIFVKGVPLQIVGLYQAKGQSIMGQDQDDLVTIPFSTAERRVLGVAAPSQAQTLTAQYPPPPNPFGLQPRLTGYVNVILVQAANAGVVDQATDQITNLLRVRHRIRSNDTPDFSVRDLSQIAMAAEGSSRVMALLLAAVASISLLVGGIGIMNILLVSVKERTREIGLRMAVGAQRLHVLLQFLAEAMFMAITGGVIGIIAGLAASGIVAWVTHWPIVISVMAIVGGFVFSAAVGIFFGFYPAREAAALDPIEALRYE